MDLVKTLRKTEMHSNPLTIAGYTVVGAMRLETRPGPAPALSGIRMPSAVIVHR